MKNDNFYKTLRIVCLILAIVCMALSLFKKAKAEEMDQYYKDYIQNYLIDNGYDSNIDLSTIFSECQYFTILTNHDNTYSYIYFTNNENIGFRIGRYSSSYKNTYSYLNSYSWGGMYYGFVSTVSYNQTDTNNIKGYVLQLFIGNGNYDLIRPVPANNISNQMTTTPTLYYCRTNNDILYRGGNIGTVEFDINKSISNYNCYMFSADDNYVYNVEKNIEAPKNNTDGFEVYKYGASGSERLVCDFSQCISISSAVGNSSNIEININIDGVDQKFNYDSTSSYYDYSVSGSRAVYSFPLSVFGINDNTISAKLNGVKIVNTTTSPGGSYVNNIVWITPLTLVGSDYEDLEPEVIPKEQMPDFDYYDDPTTQTSYNGTMNRWLTSAYSTFDYSLFTRWNFSPKYLVIGVEPYNASQALKDSLADFIRAIGNLEFGNALAEAITVGQGKTLQEQITEYLNDHLYITDLYDIIVFGYLPSENGSMEYYIYTTDSYNNHLNNSLMYDLIQQVADDGKAIEKTYDYLYDKLTDFEDKTLTKLNEMVGLQEIENGFISSLQSILNQILNALLNLNIEIPEADYTDIIDKLDTIIENQDTSDINDDWYQNYREWLYGINENDSYLSPHEYFNNIFGTLKTTFDSFTNNISFNAYLLKVEDFINHISGSTTDNLTIYLRDGIGDPGFNINNNYMYTVGGSQ